MPAPLLHGGDLDAARNLFPGAPEPFLDLSTGINPHPYPIPPLAPEIFSRLPAPADLRRLTERAAAAYDAPSAACVVVAPGSQVLVTLAARLLLPGRAVILGPTYAEHARAAAAAEHEATTVGALEPLGDADLAIAVNPNNPDGRILSRDELLAIAERQRSHDGLLIVDEAFMDAGPRGESLSAQVEAANVVVLRSFGKFFGLAGLRLSFALASPPLAAQLAAALGPWPVSGEALAIGTTALSDQPWIDATRLSLAAAAARLDALAWRGRPRNRRRRVPVPLGPQRQAAELFDRLGRAGILVRRFPERPDLLRFGLPGAEQEWQRLEAALQD